mgnify:CR=1 FL=1
MKGCMLTLSVVLSCAWIGWVATVVVRAIQFDRGCEGYLKRAADANTVALADQNLSVAVDYAQREGMVSGFTSILYRTPDEDVGFWFKNLESSLEELRAGGPEASQLERSNVLMKLRETLLDSGESGMRVTLPSVISLYPHNTAYCIFGWLLACVGVGGVIGFVLLFDME